MPWCCPWLKRTLFTQLPTPQPPCGTVWHGLPLNPVPSNPSAMYDDTSLHLPFQLSTRPWSTYGTGSPLQGLFCRNPWLSTEWLLSRNHSPPDCWVRRLTPKTRQLPMQNPSQPKPPPPKKNIPPADREQKCPSETLKLICYIDTNQDVVKIIMLK